MSSRKDEPNILVIMSDQHNKHVLGCYGNEIVRTPNLDRLASRGMRFTNAYCPSPVCVPSRMSFMTSRTPTRNQVWENFHILSSGIPTWAHTLGAAGYETTLVARMHFEGPDQWHGFEHRLFGDYSARHPGLPRQGGPWGTRFPTWTSGQMRRAVENAGRGTTVYQWFDQQVTAHACQFLQALPQKPDRPFAAVVGYCLPHCPFIGPKELFDYYYQRVDIPAVEDHQPPTVERHRRIRELLEPLPEERVRVARSAYFANCEYVDSQVGQILDCLEQNGLADNTLVIYCTDHGDSAGEHGCWTKNNYYESSAGIPLIARLDGVIEPGSVSQAVCNLIDLGPTFAQIAGADGFRGCEGRSLWPTLCGQHPADWKDETFSECVERRGGDPLLPSRMIRSGKWKLWVYTDKENLPPALFNLEDDPGELHDLGQDPAYGDVREKLLARLFADWDPEWVASQALDGYLSYKTLEEWGKVVGKPFPLSVAYPPPETEDDVELL